VSRTCAALGPNLVPLAEVGKRCQEVAHLCLESLDVTPLCLHDGRSEREGAPCLVGTAASCQPTPPANGTRRCFNTPCLEQLWRGSIVCPIGRSRARPRRRAARGRQRDRLHVVPAIGGRHATDRRTCSMTKKVSGFVLFRTCGGRRRYSTWRSQRQSAPNPRRWSWRRFSGGYRRRRCCRSPSGSSPSDYGCHTLSIKQGASDPSVGRI